MINEIYILCHYCLSYIAKFSINERECSCVHCREIITNPYFKEELKDD